MKRFFMFLIAFAIVLTPCVMSYDHVDAKGYKSVKKSFNSNTTPTKGESNLNANTNKSTVPPTKSTTSPASPSKGGLMKGLLMGGLAGLLFGSLFSNLGFLGSIFGFLINVLALVVLFALIRKVYHFFKNKQSKQGMDAWKR